MECGRDRPRQVTASRPRPSLLRFIEGQKGALLVSRLARQPLASRRRSLSFLECRESRRPYWRREHRSARLPRRDRHATNGLASLVAGRAIPMASERWPDRGWRRVRYAAKGIARSPAAGASASATRGSSRVGLTGLPSHDCLSLAVARRDVTRGVLFLRRIRSTCSPLTLRPTRAPVCRQSLNIGGSRSSASSQGTLSLGHDHRACLS